MLHQLEARLLKIHKGKRLPRLRDMSQLSAGSNFYLPSYHGLKPDQFWHEMPIREWMEVSGWSRTDIWAAFKDWNYFLNHPEKMKFARDSYDRLTKYLPMSKFERAMVMIDHERYWEAMPGQAMVRAQVLRIRLNPFEVREVLQAILVVASSCSCVSIPLKSGRCCKARGKSNPLTPLQSQSL